MLGIARGCPPPLSLPCTLECQACTRFDPVTQQIGGFPCDVFYLAVCVCCFFIKMDGLLCSPSRPLLGIAAKVYDVLLNTRNAKCYKWSLYSAPLTNGNNL